MTLVTTVTPERYFLGISLALRPDWHLYLMEPEATRSSKPESILKEVSEKKAKQAAEAARYPVSGTVTAAVVLNASGDQVFMTCHDMAQAAGAVSVRTLQWLESILVAEPVAAPSVNDCSVRLYGFGIQDHMRIMFLDALHYARVTGMSLSFAPGIWYHRPFDQAPWADPFHMLIPSELRNRDIDRQGLCDFIGIPCPDDLMEDPRQMADVARRMALKGQLFPAPPELSR